VLLLHGFPESRIEWDHQLRALAAAGFRQPAPIPEDSILASGPLKLAGVPPEKCAEYFRLLSPPGALTAALNWYRANDFEGYEQRVPVPTLFIASTGDAMVAPAGV
jgi:pimeloyl-ACP methyl ester carboxylesterase